MTLSFKILLKKIVFNSIFNHFVAGQPEFKTKDCHPQMKSGMTSIILYNN
jgi:hypothetical protein